MLHRNDQTAAIFDGGAITDIPSVGNGNGFIAVHQLAVRAHCDGSRRAGTEGLVPKVHRSVNGERTPVANAAVGVNSAVRLDLHGAYGQRLRRVDIRAALHRQLAGHGQRPLVAKEQLHLGRHGQITADRHTANADDIGTVLRAALVCGSRGAQLRQIRSKLCAGGRLAE